MVVQCPAGVQYDLQIYRNVTKQYIDETAKCHNASVHCKTILNHKTHKNKGKVIRKQLISLHLINAAVKNIVIDSENRLKNDDFKIGVRMDVEDKLQENLLYNEVVSVD